VPVRKDDEVRIVRGTFKVSMLMMQQQDGKGPQVLQAVAGLLQLIWQEYFICYFCVVGGYAAHIMHRHATSHSMATCYVDAPPAPWLACRAAKER